MGRDRSCGIEVAYAYRESGGVGDQVIDALEFFRAMLEPVGQRGQCLGKRTGLLVV
jgi:hypothetical protein